MVDHSADMELTDDLFFLTFGCDQHLGDSEQWNEETLTALAGIVAGLTVEKINKLNLTFDSAVQQIGDSKATDHTKVKERILITLYF